MMKPKPLGSRWRDGGDLARLLRRLTEVPPGKLWLLLRALVWLLVAKIALASLPVKRVIEWRGMPRRPGNPAQIKDVRWAVLVVARWSPVRFVCFPQCLAAGRLLASGGVGSRLHYGVRRGETARLETHTWLEAGGEMVIGGEVAGEFSELGVY